MSTKHKLFFVDCVIVVNNLNGKSLKLEFTILKNDAESTIYDLKFDREIIKDFIKVC